MAGVDRYAEERFGQESFGMEGKPMARKIYKARNFAQFSNLDAQGIGERLETLGDELTPADRVADARNNKSPLHPYFEWDDSVAAGQYPMETAPPNLPHNEIQIK